MGGTPVELKGSGALVERVDLVDTIDGVDKVDYAIATGGSPIR